MEKAPAGITGSFSMLFLMVLGMFSEKISFDIFFPLLNLILFAYMWLLQSHGEVVWRLLPSVAITGRSSLWVGGLFLEGHFCLSSLYKYWSISKNNCAETGSAIVMSNLISTMQPL